MPCEEVIMASIDSSVSQVFIFADSEIQALLSGYETSLAELLVREGVQVSDGVAPNPAQVAGSREKEPVSILIGTAAVILALTPVISKAISALANRPVVVTEWVCVPVEDSSGRVLRDANGDPVCTWVERARLLEPSRQGTGQEKVAISGPLGVKISYESKVQG
jgi:hypothetical protein